MLLFWVTRRSRKTDTRDEKTLTLETSFLAERRELLVSLRAQLNAEQSRSARLETENTTLLRELFSLQRFANEVVAKYDFLRTLNPAANLPTINLDSTHDHHRRRHPTHHRPLPPPTRRAALHDPRP